MKSLPGWKIGVDEVSNGVYRATLTDYYGRKAEITDTDPDRAIETVLSYGFDIEKQISQNWGLFLYQLSLEHLEGANITRQEYDENIFGSWFIEWSEKRLIYDGKNQWLTLQADRLTDRKLIEKNELSYERFNALLIH